MPEQTPQFSQLNKPVPLAQAPIEVQLAVDLIMLLEQQQLPVATVLAALALVQKDFQRKLDSGTTTDNQANSQANNSVANTDQ